ncbi:MAG: autotransporter domain-containing protein [Terricaulis sp.]
MRIRTVQLAGLAAALAGASANNAEANDVNITTATTNPVTTSAPDGVSPGNVTIAAGGSITVTAGQTAVTVNSNNNVTNSGALISNDANDTNGVLVQGGFAGPQTVSNSGAISLLETYVLADSDTDGDLDGAWAVGSNRYGIRLGGVAAFNGAITSAGTINIEGVNSGGIRLDAPLNGDLSSTGGMNIVGDNSSAISILGGAGGGVAGDVFARGAVTVRGQNSSGLIVGAPISGDLRINGGWSVTGYHNFIRPANVTGLDADDLLQGGSAVDVRFSVGGGVTIEGIGIEDDLDDDGDGLLDDGADTNDDVTASIVVFGAAPAISIQADPSANLALGPTASSYGLHVRGAVSASGVYDGVEATAVGITGSGTGAAVTTAAGIALDGDISVSAIEANSYGVRIGADANVPTILSRRQIISNVVADTSKNSIAVFIGSGANAPAFNNSGAVTAQLFGEVGNAYALTDQSNTLATITNSGTITASVTATDADPNDDVPPPPVTGAAVAIDTSASSISVTVNQIADAPFNDDDAVDNDVNSRPAVRIVGDVRLGSGADVVNLFAGLIDGDLSFGAGADSLNINNGASYGGVLTDTDGQLSINVTDGTLALEGGTTNITSANFGADSVLSLQLSASAGQSARIVASGGVSFAPGAVVTPIVPVGLPVSGSHVLLTANGGLVGGANVERTISGAGSPWLYNLAVAIDPGDANSLVADFVLKTPAQLNLTANQAILFNPLIDALRPNTDAAAALAGVDNEADFLIAYQNLMPSFASASTELAATAIQQAQGASSNRLAAVRLQGLDEISVWAQEIGYNIARTPETPNGQEYGGQGFGIALGIDGPLNNGALFGLSASFLTSEAKDEVRRDGEIASTFGQVNAYLGTALGPIDLDVIGGLGAGQMRSRRLVEIGDSFSSLSEAKWWAYEGHAAVRASAPLRLADWMIVTPQASLTYVAMQEEGYVEEGGGVGLNYEADKSLSQRLWADAGLELSGRFDFGGSIVAPRLYAGYRSNAMEDSGDRTFRLASGGPDIVLTDDVDTGGAPLVGLGVDATNGSSTISLSYEGEFGDRIERHSINAALRFKF